MVLTKFSPVDLVRVHKTQNVPDLRDSRFFTIHLSSFYLRVPCCCSPRPPCRPTSRRQPRWSEPHAPTHTQVHARTSHTHTRTQTRCRPPSVHTSHTLPTRTRSPTHAAQRQGQAQRCRQWQRQAKQREQGGVRGSCCESGGGGGGGLGCKGCCGKKRRAVAGSASGCLNYLKTSKTYSPIAQHLHEHRPEPQVPNIPNPVSASGLSFS